MADRFPPKVRSRIMASIRGKETLVNFGNLIT